jgi:hypothetical protein
MVKYLFRRKNQMKYGFVLFLMLFVAAFSFAGSNPSFDAVKSLAGDWKGTGPDGKPFTVSYQVISGGTVVMERQNEEQMVTMYYLDGNDLMLTHYCMANNQPRMKASAMNGKNLEFQFVDASNLADPGAGHMHGLILTIDDPNHIQEDWKWSAMGKMESHPFKLERVK